VSASLRDFGSSTNANEEGTEGGTILPRSLIYAATYAAAVERLNATSWCSGGWTALGRVPGRLACWRRRARSMLVRSSPSTRHCR
jgi:hypothetical protein